MCVCVCPVVLLLQLSQHHVRVNESPESLLLSRQVPMETVSMVFKMNCQEVINGMPRSMPRASHEQHHAIRRNWAASEMQSKPRQSNFTVRHHHHAHGAISLPKLLPCKHLWWTLRLVVLPFLHFIGIERADSACKNVNSYPTSISIPL